jgi:O-antigen/teichoic acid export membrane protein
LEQGRSVVGFQSDSGVDRLTQSSTSHLLANSAVGLASASSGRVLKLAFQLVVSHSLGAAGYGAFAVAYSVVVILENFTVLGLDQTLVRFIPGLIAVGRPAETAGLLKKIWLITTVASLAVGSSLYLGAGLAADLIYHQGSAAGILKLFAMALPFYSWFVLVAATMQAFHRPLASMLLSDFVYPGITLLALVVLLGSGARDLAAGQAFLVGMAAAASIGFGFFVVAKLKSPSRHGTAEPALPWRSFAAQMTLIQTSDAALVGFAPIIVGAFVGLSQAGIYNAASLIVLQTTIFYTAMVSVLPPLLARAFATGDRQRAADLLGSATRWLTMLAIPTTLLIVSNGRLVLRFFGADFEHGETFLIILGAGAVAMTATSFLGYALAIAGEQRVDLWNHVGVLALAGVGYPLAGLLWGATGVAFAVVTLQVTLASLRYLQVRKRLQIDVLDGHLARVVCIGVAVSMAFLFLNRILDIQPRGSLMLSLFCLSAYAVAVGMTLSREDRDQVRMVVTRISRAMSKPA